MPDTAVASLTPEQRKAALRQDRRKSVTWSYLFLTPYLILLIMFGVVPVGYALGLSFVDTIDGTFYGLKNYEFVFADFRVNAAIWNVASFTLLWLTIMFLGIVTLSLLLDGIGGRLSKFYRAIYFLPGAVATSALVVLWLFLLDPAVSPFGAVMKLVGWENRADVMSALSMPLVFAIMAYFTASGGWIVVLGGALSGLPKEVIEAARIDGANKLQLATRVKLPMIWRSVLLMTILSLATGLQIFVEPQLMALAGPQFARNDWSLNQMAFQYAFAMGDFGASAALSTMLVGVSITIALVIVFGTKFYRID